MTNSPMTAEPPVGAGSCEGLAAKAELADEGAPAGARRSAAPIEGMPIAGSEGATGCGFADERRGEANGVGTGCCGSILAVEARVLETSAVVDTSAAGGDAPVAAGVDEGVAASALGVTAAEALTATAGACGPDEIVALEAAIVDSDAAVDSGATAVALG